MFRPCASHSVASTALLATACLLAGNLPGASSMRATATVTPVQQVLNLLSEMKAKGELSMEAEQKIYADYSEWVSDRTRDLGFEIQTANGDIEALTAFAEKADNKVAKLGRAIAGLDDDIARLEKEKGDATTVRETEHAEFLTLQKDYTESVDALEQAIQVLSAQDYDRPQAELLLQKMSKTVPGMRRVLAVFMQEEEKAKSDGAQDGAPAVAAYKFQSTKIVTVLENLLKKFKAELDSTEEEESNQAHHYDLEMIHLSNVIAKTKEDREEKAGQKAETAAASAKSKGDLASTRKELAADKTLLADMTATFQAKTATYKANQQLRKDELEALAKAIEIISSTPVAASYAEHINSALAQVPSKQGAFLQLRSSKRRVEAWQRAAEFLRKRGAALSSRTLSTLAAAVNDGPFDKVIKMIEDLLERLKEEAAAEADHKAWCDDQLKTNKIKRETKTAKVNDLTAQIQELSAEIADMGKTIDTLVSEQSDLAKAMQEATEQREKEKAKNTDTIADAIAGSTAVKKALVILHEFYDSTGGAFLQQAKQVPEMAEYKGMHGSKKGVIGLLEVIETDFLRLESDTKAAEEAAAKEYASFMSDAKASKLQKHNLEVKTRLEKDQAEFEKSQLQKDLSGTQKALDMANKYYESLKPTCIEIHVSYEERVARRKEEIAALKEAYAILDSKGSA